LLTKWTYFISALIDAFAIPEVETPRWRATLPNKVVDSDRRVDVNTVHGSCRSESNFFPDYVLTDLLGLAEDVGMVNELVRLFR